MVIAIVQHFPNEEGSLYFAEWVNEGRDILLKFPGFIGIRQLLPVDHPFECKILLEFQSYELLRAWSASPEHAALIAKIDRYREKNYESRLYHLK